MKILLMAHALTVDRDRENEFGAYPPLGLAYLAAMLEKHGHDTHILDCMIEGFETRAPAGEFVRIGAPDDEIIERINQFKPDLIGISGNFTPFHDDAIQLARLSKTHCPDATVVMGGAHFTVAYEEAMDFEFVDFVIRGEGEYTIVELAERISSSTDDKQFGGIKGLVWKDEKGSVIVNEIRDPVLNLDELPFPAYHALNMEAYMAQRSRTFAYNKNYPIAHMITSRGCMFRCIFCSTTNNFRKFRPRSAKLVVDEIEFLVKNYNAREIHFHDDSMINDEKRIYDICNSIIDRGLKISWQISQGVTVWKMTPDLLRVMHKSGMYRVGFPIESGAKKTLKFIRKPINLERSREIIKECQRLGVYTHGNFIIGFPFETLEDIEETKSFIFSCGLDVVKLLIAQPLAGSDMFNIYLEENLIPNGIEHSSTYGKTKYGSLHFSAEELNTMRDEIMTAFGKNTFKRLLTPNGIRTIIVPKLNSVDKVGYFSRLAFLTIKNAIRKEPLFGV